MDALSVTIYRADRGSQMLQQKCDQVSSTIAAAHAEVARIEAELARVEQALADCLRHQRSSWDISRGWSHQCRSLRIRCPTPCFSGAHHAELSAPPLIDV